MAMAGCRRDAAGRHKRDTVAIIMDGKYSDLTIILEDGNANTSYKVHKIYLAMASPVLEALIDALPSERRTLVLQAGPSEAVHWLLRFIYGQDPSMACHSLALGVACLVGQYKVKALRPACLQWLEDLLARATVLQVYNAAYLLQDAPLVTKCLQLLLTCGDAVLATREACRALSEDALTFLLQQCLWVRSESVIFSAVIAWGRAQLPHHQQTCEVALHSRLQHVLPHVRVLTLTAEEIVEVVMPSGVYSPVECQALLMHRTLAASAPPLPRTCCTLLTKRRGLDAFPLSHARLPWARSQSLPLPLMPCQAAPTKVFLVAGLRVDAAVALQRLEGLGAACLREVTAAVRDAAGRTLHTAALHEGVFETPLVLEPGKTCTVTAKAHRDDWYDHWYDSLQPTTAQAAGVHFKAQHALHEGCDLYFWRLDQCFRVEF